jgi:hypothetical protein
MKLGWNDSAPYKRLQDEGWTMVELLWFEKQHQAVEHGVSDGPLQANNQLSLSFVFM